MGVIDTALKYEGTPYVWGGSTPNGFDCSGLVQYSYAQNSIQIPRVAQNQYNNSTKISKSELKKGDLIFTSELGSTNKIDHVLMYMGDNKVIESAYTKGVKTGSLDNVKNIVGYGTYNASAYDVSNDNTEISINPNIMFDSSSEWYTPKNVNIKDNLKKIVFNIFKFIIIALLIILFIVFITKALDLNII